MRDVADGCRSKNEMPEVGGWGGVVDDEKIFDGEEDERKVSELKKWGSW